MSLIHWWPLNGNLNDKGVNNKILTNNGATINSSGKIGNCYSFNGTSNYCYISENSTKKAMSLACWVKPTAFPASGAWKCIMINASQSGYVNSLFGIYFEFQEYITVIACGDSGNLITYKHNWITGQWHHLAATFNGSNTIKLYVDGNLVGTKTVSGAVTTSNKTVLGSNGSLSGAYFTGFINDARVYDHVLSAKEVKEISKGLVLHYTFEDPYIESTTNLLRNNYASQNFCPSNYKSNFTVLEETFNGYPVIHCVGTSSSNSGFRYGASVPLSSGQSFTFSIYLRYNGNKTNFSVYFGGSADGNYRDPLIHLGIYPGGTNSNTWAKETVTIYDKNKNVVPWENVVVGEWYFVVTTVTNIFSSGITIANTYFLGGSNSGTWDIVCPQIEYKDHATPFTPSSRSNQLVYDSSGYGNNGTQVNLGGDLQIVPNTCSGQYSGLFNSKCAINIGTSAEVGPEVTVNVFAYRSNWNDTTTYVIISCTQGGGWNFNSVDIANSLCFTAYCGGSYKRPAIPVSQISAGWHMFTGVVSSSEVKIYMDGVLKQSITAGGALTYPSNTNIYIGTESEGTTPSSSYKFPGNVADLKIYSTALSADDIMLEYRRKAAITRNGRLITGLFVEDDSASAVKIDKNDFIKAMHIVEYDINEDYQPVEYIQSDGNQWINTNYGNTSTPYQIDCDMEITGSAVSNYWFGQNQGHGLMMYNGLYNNNSLEFNWLTVSRTANNRCVMTQKLSSDGTTVNITMNGITVTKSVGTNDSTGNFLIFACNPNSSSVRKYGSGLRLYSFRIHEGDKNIRNFIPCYRKSDNVIGLYDTVNKVFYTNQGTGTFTKGPDVNALNIVKFGHKYTALEYIEGTGTQYIDCGTPIGDNFEFILDQMSNFNSSNHYMAGSGSSGQMIGMLSNHLWSNAVVSAGYITVDSNVRQLLGAKIKIYGASGSDWEMSNYTKRLFDKGHATYNNSVSTTNVCLFKVNVVSQIESFKCYRFILLNNNQVIRDMIPAKRNSDNAIGMFDLIERKFYTNVGTGTFRAGPEVGNLSVVNAIEIIED